MTENRNNDDIVVSSRVRLARNLKNYRFPIMMSDEEAENVINDVKGTLDYKFLRLRDMSDTEINMLIEGHIISPALAANKDRAAVMTKDDGKVSVMINEEDHVRIQVLGDGMSLNDCWKIANAIDDQIENKLSFAFDKQLGYIASCPTNIGTGMRASVMMHLPALTITGQAEGLVQAVSQLGVAVRGVYGEGTKSMGSLYQVSNQVTLGLSEEDLIEKINQVVLQIIEKEREVRENLIKNNKEQLEDQVYRAYGILKYAKSISTEEAMRLLSLLQLGIDLNLIEGNGHRYTDKMMIRVQPNYIQCNEGSPDMTPVQRDMRRAEIVKEELA